MENNTNLNENTCSSEKQKCCLCKPQSIFNIVAALLIIILLILQFYNPFRKSNEVVLNNGGLNIAYVESDSIMTNYILVDTLMEELKSLSDSLDKEFSKKQQAFEARVNLFQQNVQNGKIQTKDQYAKQEAALAAEQQQLMNLRDSYLAQVQLKQMSINQTLLDSLTSVIKKNPKDFPYDYVLDFNKGSGLLYANDKLNITEKIIEKLNSEYKK